MSFNNTFRLSILFKFLVCIRALVVFVPYINYKMPTSLNVLIVVLLFLFIYHYLLGMGKKLIKPLLPIAIFLILDFIWGWISGGPFGFASFLYGMLQFFIWPLLVIAIIKSRDIQFAKFLLFVVFLCYVLTGVTTYIGCVLYPGATRELASLYSLNNSEKIELYHSLNIGGFDFIYSLVLLVPLFIFLIKYKSTNFSIKFLSITSIVGLVLVVLKSEYTTALLCLLLGISCFFIISKKGDISFLPTLVCVVIFFIIFDTSVGSLFYYLSSQIGSEIVSSRLEGLADIINGYNSNEIDIDKRQDLYLLDLNLFLSSPIWGVGKAEGGHSFILIYLAKFGFIGLTLLVYFFRKLFDYSIKPFFNSPIYSYLIIIFILQIILSILNPMIIYDIFIFIIPLFTYVFVNND